MNAETLCRKLHGEVAISNEDISRLVLTFPDDNIIPEPNDLLP